MIKKKTKKQEDITLKKEPIPFATNENGYLAGAFSITPNPQSVSIPSLNNNLTNITNIDPRQSLVTFASHSSEPDLNSIKFPIGALVRCNEKNPDKAKICLGAVEETVGGVSKMVTKWGTINVDLPTTNNVIALWKIQNDGVDAFTIAPASDEMITNFTKGLKATQNSSNSFNVEAIGGGGISSDIRIRLNGDPNQEIAYTLTEQFLNFNATGNTTLTKGAENELIINSGGSGGGSDPNAIHTIETDSGDVTSLNNVVVVNGVNADGLTTTGTGNVLSMGVVDERYIPKNYTTGELYLKGEGVWFLGRLYICTIDTVATPPIQNQLPSEFVPITSFVRQLKIGNVFVVANQDGALSFISLTPNTLSITDNLSDPDPSLHNQINFSVTAVVDLIDSAGNGAGLINNKIQLTCAGGSVVKTAEGVLEIRPPSSTGLQKLIGGGVEVSGDTSGAITLASQNSNMTIIGSAVANEILFNVANRIGALHGGSDNLPTTIVVPNSENVVNITSSDLTTLEIKKGLDNSTLLVNIKNVFARGIKTSNNDIIGLDSAGYPKITIGTETDLTFTRSGSSTSTGVISQTSNTLKAIVVDGVDQEIVPSSYANGSKMTLIGTPATADTPGISVTKVGDNAAQISINGTFTSDTYSGTGLTNLLMQSPTFDPATLTLVVYAGEGVIYNGQSFESISWAQQTITVTTISGIWRIWIRKNAITGNGEVFSKIAWDPADLRNYIRIGIISVDSAVVTNSTFFYNPVQAVQNSLQMDQAASQGAVAVKDDGTRGGLFVTPVVVSTTIANINVSNGKYYFPSINAVNSPYENPNYTDTIPAKTPSTNGNFYRNAAGVWTAIAGGITQNLLLTNYYPSGVSTTIPNNAYCFMVIYSILTQPIVNTSYIAINIGDSTSTSLETIILNAQTYASNYKYFISGVPSQYVLPLGVVIWQRNGNTYTSFLRYLPFTDGLLITGAGGTGTTPITLTDNISKKGVISNVLQRITLTNNNLTITVNAGSGYLLGVITNWNLRTWTEVPLAGGIVEKKMAVASSTGGIFQFLMTNTYDFENIYSNYIPLFTYCVDNVNGIHNINTFQESLFKVELSGNSIHLFRTDAYRSDADIAVYQASAGALLDMATITRGVTHKVLNDTFNPASQSGLPRYSYNPNTNQLIPYTTLPSDNLWRYSIIFLTNCEEKPIVKEYENLEILEGLDSDKIISDIKKHDGKIYYLDKNGNSFARSEASPKLVGKNTGRYFEVFLNTDGDTISARMKEDVYNRFMVYYSYFFDCFAVKYMVYKGNTVIRATKCDTMGRPAGSFMCLQDSSGATTVPF